MRVGINALFNATGGSLKNLQQLLLDWKGLVSTEHEFVIFASDSTYEKIKQVTGDRYTLIRVKACSNVLTRILVEQMVLPFLMIKHRIKVLFCPANTIPFFTNVPCVVTFQNAAPFCDTLKMKTVGIKQGIQFCLLGIFIRLAARRATHVIFISHFFRNLLHDRFGFDQSRGSVIYRAKIDCPLDEKNSNVLKRYGIEGDFVFSTSHLISYKNIHELILGYSIAQKEMGTHLPKLYIAGGEYVSGYRAVLQSVIDASALRDKVILLGSIPYNDVTALLQRCLYFVFTSTCENCPTALIEAMSAGKPIACSDVGVMPEIAGDAACYFDPFEPASIAKALVEMSNHPEVRQLYQSRLANELQKIPCRDEIALETLRVIETAATTPLYTTAEQQGR